MLGFNKKKEIEKRNETFMSQGDVFTSTVDFNLKDIIISSKLIEKSQTIQIIEGLVRADIYFNTDKKIFYYDLTEPIITMFQKEQYEVYKELILLDQSFSLKMINYNTDLENIIDWIKLQKKKYNLDSLNENDYKVIGYNLLKFYSGMGELLPIFMDPNVEDISASSQTQSVNLFYKKLDWIQSTIRYEKGQIEDRIKLLSEKAGKEASINRPQISGTLPDGSRMECTYFFGDSSFTIRKFQQDRYSIIHLINFGAVEPKLAAILWFLVEQVTVCKILVAGGTGTGKTTFLNALLGFLPRNRKIVSIEEHTPELKLPDNYIWTSMITDVKSDVKNPDTALISALRQKPDYIILGEARGDETETLFNGMNSGHAGLATFHANNYKELELRMTSEQIGLDKKILSTLNYTVFLNNMKVDGLLKRQVRFFEWIKTYDEDSDNIIHETPIEYNYKERKYEYLSLEFLESIASETPYTKDEIVHQINLRTRFIEQLIKEDIKNFEDTNRLFNIYLYEPNKIKLHFNDLKGLLEREKQKELN